MFSRHEHRGGGGPDRADDRGQANVIGVALLMGMILVGAGLAVVSAGMLIDGLQQQAQEEQQDTSVNVMNDRVSDVAATGDARKLPSETLEGGTASVAKDTSSFELSTDHSTCGTDYSFTLSSFVYTDSDRTWVLEGGGQWQVSEDGTAWVRKAPGIGYDDQQLSINLVSFNKSNIRDGEVVAKHSGEPVIDQDQLTQVIRCPGGDSKRNAVWLNVTSEYITAWDEHLSEAITGANVTYYGPEASRTNDDEINILIDKLVRQRFARFTFSGGSSGASRLVTFQEGLTAAPTVSNYGGTDGSTEVTLYMNPESRQAPGDPAPGPNRTQTTSTLDPGEDETVTFDIDANDLSQIAGVSESKRFEDVSQYGRYKYNITTDSAGAESAFFLSHSQPFYRLESVTHDMSEENIAVSAEFTNITATSHDPDLNFTLRGESTNGVEINRTEILDVQTDAWNQSTFSIDINRTRLPYGEYNYTVELEGNHEETCDDNPDACSVTREFTLDTGAGISNVSKIRIDEPANVSVSVIGTEITFESLAWLPGEGLVRKRGLAPVTATAVVDGERVRFTQDGTVPVDDPHEGDVEEHNLNTVGTRDRVYDYDTTVDEGAVTIEATHWDCEDYDYVNTDTYEGTTYLNYECTEFDEDDYTQVTVSGGGGSSDDGFLMTRDKKRNAVPDIDNVLPRQRELAEVFQDGTDDIALDDGALSLNKTDFGFMMEMTMTQSKIQSKYPNYEDNWDDINTSNSTAMNQAAWEIARNERDAGQTDPDFNDVIGVVQVEGGKEEINRDELEDPLFNKSVNGIQREIETDGFEVSDSISPEESDTSIDVRVDEIVIE